jgi:3-deoxy-D-manno-octulosonic acid kinase
VIRPLLHGIPHGYALHQVGATWLALDISLQRELVDLRLADAGAREALFERAQLRGRGRTPTVHLPNQHSLVLRRYRHGGLLGWLTANWLWGPSRARWELEVTVRAERADAPVPHVACVAAWPVAGPFWSALIGTVEIEDGEELLGWLRRSRSVGERVALARQVGRSIRRLHDTGIEHRDLQLRNILIRPDTALGSRAGSAGRVVVIDLDGARHHGLRGVPISRRAQNLGRLARSVIKLGLWGRSVGARERAAFLAGYLQRDRGLRRLLRAYARRERAKLILHRAGYRLRADSSGLASSTSITGMPSSIG